MNQTSLGYSSAIYPLNFEQPLPSATKATNLTEVTPAKKITFYKSGDPQFTGAKMAVNNRTFKTFDALLDDLTQKVSLPFGVRTVTTPHGIHSINSLEQLEDGGSYICSDKKHVKPINMNTAGRKPATWQGNNPSNARRNTTQRARQEDSHVHRIHMAHKKIILIKNGNVGIHYSIVLHKRHTHSFRSFLDEISELMQYSVRKLYTVDGRNIDTLQALFHCPNVLVCVGHEASKPIVHENFRRKSSEKLPGLTRRSRANINNESSNIKKNVNFGLEAKKSVIHPRLPSRSSRFSLSSDKSYPNGLNMSSSNSDDDIEKRVHVNKDGSLSVEMKVRFRLLNRETLQWSTQIRRSSLTRNTSYEHLCSVEDCATEQVEPMHPDNGFDGSFYPCNADGSNISKLIGAESEKKHCENCCKHFQGYNIWKNPMYPDKITEVNSRNVRHTHSSCSSTSSCRRAVYKRESVESIQTTSSEECTQHFVQQTLSHSETVENGDGGVKYCSASFCSSQSGNCTSDSKTVGHHESGTSISRAQSVTSHHISSHSSTNINHQNSHDEHLSCVSPSNSTASSKRKVAVKTADIEENDRPATSFTSSAEASVDLKDVDSTAAGDKPISNISESFHHLKCNKQIKDECSSGGAQNVPSSYSKHSIDGCKELITLNHLCPSTASSCSTQFSGKTNATSNVGYAEEGKAYSVVSNSSLNIDKNPNREIYEDNKPTSDISLSSVKSKTDSHITQDLNEYERQSMSGSSPEVHGINYELHFQDNDTNGRPVSNTTYSSSKKSNKCTRKMEADDDRADSVLSWSSTSLAAQRMSLTASEDSNVSCSENLSEKNRVKLKYPPATSIHSELSSLSECAEVIVTNSKDRSQRSSNSESINCSSSNSTRRSRSGKAKSEDDYRPSTSVSGNSKPNLKAGEEGKPSNEDKTPTSCFSEVLQTENNIKMERERCENTNSICSTVSKASRVKAEAERQEQKQVEDELKQTGISKLSNVAKVELLSCKVDEGTVTQTNSVTENASVQSMPQSFPQKGKADGKNARQLLTNPGLKSKSSMNICSSTTAKVTGEKNPASRPTTSGSRSNLSEKSTSENPHNENINQSDSKRNSEKVSSKEKCKHSNNIKKNKNKTSTDTVAVACGKNYLIPDVLPNASLEEVVYEWLKKIPSENMLVKYDSTEEFQDKSEKSAIDVMPEGENSGAEATTTLEEKPREEESAVSNQESKEKNDSEMVKMKNSGSPKAEDEGIDQHIVEEVDILQSKPISSCCSVIPTINHLHEKVLPNNVHSSVEILKALLSPRQKLKLDRSNSLPNLNLAFERKLSHSAKALLTRFTSLQFFDKESLHYANKFNNANNSASKGFLKSFWLADIAEECEGEVSQPAVKHSKTFKGHNSADDNGTSVSSFGVDVNSGSGGSGDSSMDGATDVSLATEKKKRNLDLRTSTNKKNDTSKQKQPFLMKNSFDENAEMCDKPNEKNEEYSISSAESILTGVSCRKAKLRNCSNAKNKSEGIDNIEKRSLSRNSRISQSEVAPPSPVTPDIACRVQWSSGEQSNNGEDLDENIDSNAAESPQDMNQNLKEQAAPDVDGLKPSAGNSCDMKEIVQQTKANDHNEAVDVDDPEEDKIVHDKIPEKCNSTGIVTPQQITSDHCCAAQAVIADQKPVPAQRKSFDPDPAWLMKLLKKMEKQFITHYVDSVNEFKIKWKLEDDDRLDQMIADLREDVSRRIQRSIERELKKIQSRAGRKRPSPPQEPQRCESSEQTEQRRRRLKAMYKIKTFSPHAKESNSKSNHEQSTDNISSLISDEDLNFSEMLGDNADALEQFNRDKFCPCDSCTEISNTSKIATNAIQRNIPIVKDFDLREILMMNLNRPNEQIKKHVTDTDEPEELLDREINNHDCGESESIEPVQNKIEHVIQNDEPVNEYQENVNVNNECENHKLDRTLDQDEEKVSTGNDAVGPNFEDIDECKDDLEDKSEGYRESPNIKSDDAQESIEDKEDDVYKDEIQHKHYKKDFKCIECETANTENNLEEASTATEEYKVQKEENNVLHKDTDPETENNNKLEGSYSVDSQQEYEVSENNIRVPAENNIEEVDETTNLDNDISELSDEHVKSNAVKSQIDEVVEDMNAKSPAELSASLDVISCPQHSSEGILEDSAKEDTDGDNVQINTKEATSSSSNSPGNKSSKMYPESSSDEDRKSICTSPEACEDQNDAGNDSDPEPDQQASMRNKSQKPGNSEFDEDDLDF
ncbi:retinitis pigmentosa 1-like 1 protein [Heptranchias perlo]|uniref:retinitis pigmentosa 1-like 1 protein n=1 Tax=Heptranchias perlo TaxID=212740 RepID=UPI00355AA2D1